MKGFGPVHLLQDFRLFAFRHILTYLQIIFQATKGAAGDVIAIDSVSMTSGICIGEYCNKSLKNVGTT